MNEIIIDCTAVHGRSDLHQVFAEALSFPEYYGKNLDALYDCLTAISGTIRMTNWEQNGMGVYARAVRKVLETAAAHNPQLTIFFE